jgi:UDP-N-acetylglucosamine--N-acetylmuramyl-(pentapeptide) pyrophosphoryl-undecaprenol N-acetylglucosamine transferase
MRVVVSGGGTAGHISPVLATCDALESLVKDLELLYIGQADGMEARIVQARGMRFEAIKAGKFRRNHFDSGVAKLMNPATIGPNARDAFKVVQGVSQSMRILRKFKPDVVFAKSGYVALPVGIAAHLLKLPLVIHESDVSLGLANRIMSKWADKIAVGFPVKNYRELDPGRLVFVGNPVRAEIMKAHRLEGLAKFELTDALPVVLVTGGSLGAREINEVVVAALPELLKFCQVMHITGEHEYEGVKFAMSRASKLEHADRYRMFGYLSADMALALAAADVVVARAGANTIAELAVLQKPTVLIPNMNMAGHQALNAQVLARAGAARVLSGDKVTADRVVGEIKRLAEDRDEQKRLSQAIGEFGRKDAAEKLAEIIIQAPAQEKGSAEEGSK